MTTDEQYTPTEGQVRAWCREGTGDYPDVMDEWLDRFLARVRRDAARGALIGAEQYIRANMDEPYGDRAATRVADYARTHYPEETP